VNKSDFALDQVPREYTFDGDGGQVASGFSRFIFFE